MTDHLWVFGYGSLMWRPGFPYRDMRSAILHGYRRDMCFLSIHYRGRPDAPGLVCGLVPSSDPTVGCAGRAYFVHADEASAVISYLDERELITDIYIPQWSPISLDDGREVPARVYVADTSHEQYVGDWPADRKAAFIATGSGSEGTSLDYLDSLAAHLNDLGIEDAHMKMLLAKARRYKGF